MGDEPLHPGSSMLSWSWQSGTRYVMPRAGWGSVESAVCAESASRAPGQNGSGPSVPRPRDSGAASPSEAIAWGPPQPLVVESEPARQGSYPAAPEHLDLISFLALLHKNLDLDKLLCSYVGLVGGLIPAPAIAIYLLDPSTSRPIKMVAQGADPRFLSAYEARGRQCDPVFSNVARRLETTSSRLVLPETSWEGHPFHRVLSVGSLEAIMEAPIVNSEKGLVGTLNFGRSPQDPPFDDDEISTIDRIAQHVSIAVSHACELNELREHRSTTDGVLGAMDTGVMLTDSFGSIQFLNLAARRVLQECEASPALASAVKEALVHNLNRLTASRPATRCIRLPRRCLDRSAYLTIRSVRLARDSDLVLTFWFQPNQEPNFEHLHDLLTTQEIRVLELLAQGLENKQIAEYLTVSVDTVKSHLKRIFCKMNVTSRAQLLSRLFYQT